MNLAALDKATKDKTKTSGISPFSELQLSKVYPNPDQPRKHFDEAELNELAAAIKNDGLLQPIVVAKRDNGYILIAGERRYRAHLIIKKRTIKAHIIIADDKKIQELALIENIQRTDLTDFEIAKFIAECWNSGNYAQKQDLADAIGKTPSYISKALKALNLSDEILSDIQTNKKDLGLEILQELSGIEDKDKQLELYKSGANRKEIREAKSKKKISPAKKENNIIFQDEILGAWGMSDLMARIRTKIIENNEDSKYKITIEEI